MGVPDDADHHDCAHPGDHALVTGDRADAKRSPSPFLSQEADRQQSEDQGTENPIEDDQDPQSDPGGDVAQSNVSLWVPRYSLSINDNTIYRLSASKFGKMCQMETNLSELPRGRKNPFLSPFQGSADFRIFTQGLRPGLYSCAASRLNSIPLRNTSTRPSQ